MTIKFLLMLFIATAVSGTEPFSQARNNSIATPSSIPDQNTSKFKLNNYVPSATSKVITNVDMNSTFFMDIDENGTKNYSEALNLANKRTIDSNGTFYYQPNNSQLMEMFKDRKGKTGTDFVNKMTNNSQMMKEMQSKRGDQLKKEYIYKTYADTKEVGDMKIVDNLQAKLFATAAKPKTIQCFVKRKMIPKYYCPLNGVSYGARVGGDANDDADKVKRECNSFCKTASFGCRNVPIDGSISVRGTTVLVFEPSNPASMGKQIINFDFNTKQKIKSVKYKFLIEWTQYAIDHNLTDKKPTIELMSSTYRLEKGDFQNNNMTLISDRYPYRVTEIYGEFEMHTYDQASKGAILFYPPRLIQEGMFSKIKLQDIVKKITISGADIEYIDNKYHFCGATQIVLDPSTECKDGIIYDVNATDGLFRICKSDSIKHGPEKTYGAYYSETECDEACHESGQCIETYEHLLNITGNEQYKISVGCVGDPFNSACTQSLCEQYFREHRQPMEEKVYSREGTSKTTVHSGVQTPGVIRPRVDIDAELNANNSTSPDAYKEVFAQAKKDAAYQAMIQKGTYNYSKNSVGKGQSFENAARLVTSHGAGIDYGKSVNDIDTEIWWKLKPSSVDINSEQKNLYVVAKIENIFTPKSGSFLNSSSITSISSESLYKDIMYAYVGPNNTLKPFYIEEYAQIQNDTNNTKFWSENETNRKNWYVTYNPSVDSMLAASDAEAAMKFKTKSLDGSVNYEEFKILSAPKLSFETGKVLIQSQQVVNNGALPIKHYANFDKNSTGVMANFTLHGFYSSNSLTNKDALEKAQSGQYQFFSMFKGKKNKEEIHGDGVMQNKNVKLFVKGQSSNMTVSAELTPSIEEEDKDATVYMFLFEQEPPK